MEEKTDLLDKGNLSPESNKIIEMLSQQLEKDGFEADMTAFVNQIKPKTQAPAEDSKKTQVEEDKEEAFDYELLSELSIKLTPVQAFALLETVLSLDFVKKSNKFVTKIGKTNSMAFDTLYSGAFAGTINKMIEDNSTTENIKENMASTLINVFMAELIGRASNILDNPIDRRLIASFLKKKTELSFD